MKKPHTSNSPAKLSPLPRTAILLFAIAATAFSQQRPPAVPLITHDPYFSVWSMADTLTAENTRHWTGAQQPLIGLIRIDGKPYRFMGTDPRELPAMKQLSVQVNATSTVYTFEAAGLHLNLTFFTPAFPQDLTLLSRPVTYLTWTVSSTDSVAHQVAICLDIDPRIAVNTPDQAVTWSRSQANGLTVLNVGSQEQRPLNRSGDNLRIDWGYFHLAVPESEPSSTVAASGTAAAFAKTGDLPKADDMDMPRSPSTGAAHLAVVLPANIAAGQTVTRHVLVSYTEGFAIEYLQRRLKPYWQRNGQSTADMLTQAEEQYPALAKTRHRIRPGTRGRPHHRRRQALRRPRHPRLPPDPRRAQARRRRRRNPAHVLQRKLQQRLHRHRRRPLSRRALLSIVESGPARGPDEAAPRLRRASPLEVALRAPRPRPIPTRQRPGLRRRRTHRR